MKHRNPLAVVFFSIITLGIYDFYWLVKTKSVLNKATKFHTPTIWLLILPYFLLIGCYILLFVSAGSNNFHTITTTNAYGQQTTQLSPDSHLKHPGEFFGALAGTIACWLLVLTTSVIWFFKFSKAVNAYTKGKMSTAVTFLVLWLIHLIGVALVQDAFNDMPSSRA